MTRRIRRVGLTGGIAAGKSVVAKRLAELGAVVVDHDVLARAVLEPGSDGARAVRETFGDGVMSDENTVDRAALAEIVFADEQALEKLEQIVHPIVRSQAQKAEADARRRDADVIVVHDVPLLVETGQEDSFDQVVVVAAPEPIRLNRLASRGLDEVAARARIAAQANDATRNRAADVLLDGGGTVANLRRQVDELWSQWQ
jgi:dephospho-CoA kinase